ncbi:MAG: low affinity iron permease family protein [bacterium]
MTKLRAPAKPKTNTLSGRFNQAAKWTARKSGHPSTFIGAVCFILLWAFTGPVFGFSDTWQLVINTSTTIVTFLMVFLIQNTQNRDSEAMQVKVDELIRSIKGARNMLLNLEDMDDEEISSLRESYIELAEAARRELENGKRKRKAASRS